MLLTLMTQIVCFSMVVAKLRTFTELNWIFIFIPQFALDLLGICLLMVRCVACCSGPGICCDEESHTPAWGPGILLTLFGLPLKIAFDVLLSLYVYNHVAFFIPAACLSVLFLFLTIVLLLYGVGVPRYCMYLCDN